MTKAAINRQVNGLSR